MTGEKTTLPALLARFDQDLADLQRLHLRYEETAKQATVTDEPGQFEAAELSAAVGRFLAEHGYEAVI